MFYLQVQLPDEIRLALMERKMTLMRKGKPWGQPLVVEEAIRAGLTSLGQTVPVGIAEPDKATPPPPATVDDRPYYNRAGERMQPWELELLGEKGRAKLLRSKPSPRARSSRKSR